MSDTLLNLLDRWALEREQKTAYIFLDSYGREQEVISFKSLKIRALEIAHALHERKLTGERVVIALPPGLDFIATFLGCLYAQAIAVPLPPPRNKRQLARSLPVFENAMPALMLLDRGIENEFSFPCLTVEALLNSTFGKNEILPCIMGHDTAFLQYTSGSTSLPKGVVLTHSHLFYHQKVLKKAFAHDEETIIVGWLPFYHDMGLIGNILHSLYLGVTSILMAPTSFVQHPILWLEAITRYRATTSGGPNFAYQHCVAKIGDRELEKLDLSSWKIAFNGSERVQSDTLEAFSKRFEKVGFCSSNFYPCYGLAEATLFVTGRLGGHSLPFETTEGQTTDVVNCGSPALEDKILIVDPNSKEICCENIPGEIWVQGPTVAGGYWNKEEESKVTFSAFTTSGRGPFLRTGDIGFVSKNELFILGRLKNLVIIRGKNYFPHDLENCVRKAHPLLNHTQGVTFSEVTTEGEGLIVVQEIDRNLKNAAIFQELLKSVKKSLIEDFDISPLAVIFVRPNSLPRTTSGKLQQHLAREQFQNNLLSPLFSWRQRNQSDIAKEKSITDIAAQLLSLSAESISPEEPLVALGLDSLIGMQFLRSIRETFEVDIDLSFVLNGATIRQIELEIEKSPKLSFNLSDLSPSEFPLSWNQENVWVFHQLNPQSLAYNILFGVRLKGSLDTSAFKRALGQVISRHGALRTRFETGFKQNSSAPVQIVSESVEPPLFVYNLKEHSRNQREIEIQNHLINESKHHFLLNQPPLFRVVVLEVCEDETILIFHFHHMICDGWSVGIFINELDRFYIQCLQHVEESSPTSVFQYDTFVNWQKEIVLKEDHTTVESHWKQLLWSEEYPILSISPFLGEESDEGSGAFSLLLNSTDLHLLKAFSAQQCVTLPVILMSVFHAILHLYSAEESIYLGYPAANRPNGHFQQMIGFFVNTLVSKTVSKSDTTFLDIIDQVKKNLWQDAKQASYPLQHLLNLLRPPRFADTSPLFQAMFVMQNAPVHLKKFGGLEMELLKTPEASSLYPLVLEVREKEAGLELIFEYQKNKIDSSFVEHIGMCYVKLLKQALKDPFSHIEKYSLANSDNTIGNPKHELKQTDIIDLFDEQVFKTPKKIAIFSDQGTMTYEELHKAMNSIADRLRIEIEPGELIGVCLNKEPLLIASILGILKAGGAYVPIDPVYPQSRIQLMIEEAHIRFLILNEEKNTKFSFFKGTFVNPSVSATADGDSLNSSKITPELPAYLLYTSGTTGKPKGVIVRRRNLTHFALAATEAFEMKASDVSLQFSSISWDTSSEEIYPCLLNGGSLVLRSDGPVESFEDLLLRTKTYQITIWNLPSSYWHDLVESMHRKKISPPSSLRLVIVGGEKVNRSKVDLWHQHVAPKVKLLNTYGVTEATSISATYDLSQWKREWKDVPIGNPIQNVQLYILNASLKPVPPGMPGTLFIGGRGLAKGYLNLEGLTQQKFIPHPITGELIYNTGDTAYYSLTGEILLKGRKDRQIKRRGFRVELEEIEKTLLKLEQIETCLVTSSSQVMRAYVVTSQSVTALSSQTIKAFLRETLPDYLIPDQILFVEAIPRLANGKIDFLSLQSIRTLKPRVEDMKEAMNDIEKTVFLIWQSLLKLESIKKDESFFDLGGNSLLLIQLHEKIQETFSIQLNISILFSHFTISSQSQKIQEIKFKKSKLSRIEILKQLEQGLITPIQARELMSASNQVR